MVETVCFCPFEYLCDVVRRELVIGVIWIKEPGVRQCGGDGGAKGEDESGESHVDDLQVGCRHWLVGATVVACEGSWKSNPKGEMLKV